MSNVSPARIRLLLCSLLVLLGAAALSVGGAVSVGAAAPDTFAGLDSFLQLISRHDVQRLPIQPVDVVLAGNALLSVEHPVAHLEGAVQLPRALGPADLDRPGR